MSGAGPPSKRTERPSVASPTGLIYTVDNAHSYVEFSVRLLGFNRVRGTFPTYTAHVYYDSTATERSSVSVRLAVAGVSTHVAERDRHLESADFFDAPQFPYIFFESRSVRPGGGGFVAEGDLTIRGVTRSLSIPFDITAPLAPDPFGNPRFSAAGRLVINRRDFGVNGPAFWSRSIGDSVEIDFEVGCRRFNYENLGWGDAKRRSIGRHILETRERSGLASALREWRELWRNEHGNPAWNFGLFEYSKCAGRLGQSDRAREGAEVLGQAIELHADSMSAGDLTTLRCQRADLLLRAGDTRGARTELQLAEASDSTGTFVRVLSRALGD